MSKLNIVFWTQTGNTEAMAEAVKEGVVEAGKEANVVNLSEVASYADLLNELKEAGGFALGCPAMGAEVLEECEMEPFVADVEAFASGKQIALFGSYGWGDGQWMRDWEERMQQAGANVVFGEGVIGHEEPDADAIEQCKQLGKALADAINA